MFSAKWNPPWNLYRFNWALAGTAIAALALGLTLTEFHLRLTSFLIVAAVAGLYGVCGYMNAVSPTRCNPRIALPLTATAQIIVLLSTLTALTYLATSANLPLMDADLHKIDIALGWDFRAYLAFIDERSWLVTVLAAAYRFIGLPILIITILLPLAGFYRRAGEFISAFTIALLITTCLSTVVPAIGAYGTVGISPGEFPNIVPQAYHDGTIKIPALRDGSLRELDLLNLDGVLTFPSFHAAAAVLYLWAFWGIRWLRPANLLINGAMIVATPVGGGHYLIDVLAGIAVACVSIYFASRIAAACDNTELSGIAGQASLPTAASLARPIPATATTPAVPIDPRSWIAATALVLLLFVASATVSAYRKPITRGFDEVAHISYVAHLQTGAPKWPRFSEMRMIDPTTFSFNSEHSYLNHPPFYYWLVAAVGPHVLQQPASLTVGRLLNVALVAMGVVVLLVLAQRMKLDRIEFYAFAVMIAATPVLSSLAGSVNNDNLGLFGGAITLLGLHAYAGSSSRIWLIVACCGLLAASAAKLTGLLLVGTTMVAAVALLAMYHKVSKVDAAIVMTALAVAASPYLMFIIQYGSPAPNTPAQSAMLTSGSAATGWAGEPRMHLLTYTLFFLKSFLMEWMPALRPRGMLQLSLLVLPTTIILISVAGWIASIRRLLNRAARPSDFIVVAGMTALALTLMIHIGFSYERHLETGWLMDAYPRYYLPLIAVVPMAALAGSSAVLNNRLRDALQVFLVAAPIIFGLFGASIG